MGKPRESVATVTKYAEVNSDVDMSEDELKVGQGGIRGAGADSGGDDSDAYGQATKTKNKKRRSKGKKGKAKGAFTFEMFVHMPIDVVTEIMSYLSLNDLVSLTCTSKVFRSLLLAEGSHSIWKKTRIAQGIPQKFSDLDEYQFAKVLSAKQCCMCGKTSYVKFEWAFRQMTCKSCRTSATIRHGQVAKKLPRVHPRAPMCVPYEDSFGYKNRKHFDYRIADLETVSVQLWDLQEEDDNAEESQYARRLQSGTRSRRTSTVEFAPSAPSLVEKFVEEKSKICLAVLEEARSIKAAVYEADVKERQRLQNAHLLVHRLREDRMLDIVARTLPLNLPYSTDQIEEAAEDHSCEGEVLTDQEWTTLQPKIIATLEHYAAQTFELERIRELRKRESARSRLVEPYCLKLVKSLNTGGVNPTFDEVTGFSSVCSAFVTDRTTVGINEDSWEEHLPQIMADVAKFREDHRIRTIRTILHATTDVPLSSLPSDSASYPPSKYDTVFFNKITSRTLFNTRLWRDRRRNRHLVSYPASHSFRDNGLPQDKGYTTLSAEPSRATVAILRSLLASAGLDEETATPQDLTRAQGSGSFMWKENTVKKGGQVLFNWKDLLNTIIWEVRGNKERPYPVPTITLVKTPVVKSQDNDSSEEEESEDEDSQSEDQVVKLEDESDDDKSD